MRCPPAESSALSLPGTTNRPRWCGKRRLFLSAAEEARPEAAILEGAQFGFEADALFIDGGLLFDELDLLLHETLAFSLEPCLLLFEGGDGLLLQLALELEEVEALDLAPQAVYLRARRVPLVADLVDLSRTLLEAGLVVLALLKQALVALERNRRKTRVALECSARDSLPPEGLRGPGAFRAGRAGRRGQLARRGEQEP